MSTDHNFGSKRRAEADSNRGPSAYQSTALPLGQTGPPVQCTDLCRYRSMVQCDFSLQQSWMTERLTARRLVTSSTTTPSFSHVSARPSSKSLNHRRLRGMVDKWQYVTPSLAMLTRLCLELNRLSRAMHYFIFYFGLNLLSQLDTSKMRPLFS